MTIMGIETLFCHFFHAGPKSKKTRVERLIMASDFHYHFLQKIIRPWRDRIKLLLDLRLKVCFFVGTQEYKNEYVFNCLRELNYHLTLSRSLAVFCDFEIKNIN